MPDFCLKEFVGRSGGMLDGMANYQGLNCIMREITMMASNEKNPIHEQHIYDYFTVTEKFVRTAVPQLVADYLEQFQERLVSLQNLLNPCKYALFRP